MDELLNCRKTNGDFVNKGLKMADRFILLLKMNECSNLKMEITMREWILNADSQTEMT